MALDKPRDIVTYPDLESKNLTPGEGDNAAKRIDGVYFDANNTDTNNALGVRQGFGVDFVDNGSGVGECRVTTPTGLFDAEHYVTIGDGTRVWKTQMTADDDLRFDDADIVNGAAGPADYSAAAFIDSLVVWATGSDTVSIMVDNTGIVLVYNEPNALTGDDIARSPTDSEKLDTSLTNLENALDAEHNVSTGVHDDGFLEPAMVNEDTVFAAEAWQNAVRYGRFDNWPGGVDSPPEGWALYGAPTAVEQETGAGNVLVGTYSVKITTGGTNRGIQYAVPNYSDYRGKTITASGWMKQSAAGIVAITIDDGVGTTTGDGLNLGGSFSQASCRHEVDASATELTIIVHSTDGTSPTFYLDAVSAYEGEYLKAHSFHPAEVIAGDDVVPVNWLLNPTLGHWWDTTALSGHPDYWEAYTLINAANYYTTNPYFGNNCLRLDDTAGVGVGECQRIGAITPILSHLKGKTVCFSVFVKEYTPGTAKNWIIQIEDGVGSSSVEFDQDDYADWTRVWVVHTIAAAATTLVVSVQSNQVAAAGLLVDGACLNIGSRPMKWAGNMPSVWTPVRYNFGKAGTWSDATYSDEYWPVPERFYPFRLDVLCKTGPAAPPAGDSTFELYTAASGAAPAATGFSVSISSGSAANTIVTATQSPSAANSDVIAEESHVEIYHTLGAGAAPQDVYAMLTGYTLALP
jgi:hypothetical protein